MKFIKPITESQLQASLQAEKDNEYKSSVSSAINAETLERIACDTAIVNSLAEESLNRNNADNALQAAFQSSIAAERTARINADTSLTDEFNAKIQAESTDRAAQIKTVGDALNAEVNQRQNAVVTLTSAINQIQTQINNDATVKSALENEISARTGESASINSAIDGLKALHNLDKADLQSSINAEKSARQSDVSILQSSISALDSDYKAADVTLKSYVDAEISNLKSSDTAIISLLNGEVTLRADQTSSLASALSNEVNQRASNFNSASNSISAINNALNAEIANRQNKDSQLQTSLETAVTNFNAAYKVFGGSTTEHAGTAGIVPPPPILEDSDTVYYLTNKGWGEPIELDIKIGKVPSQAGTLTFNGQTRTPDWNDYDPLALEITGTTSASDAGTYTVYFQPRDGYKWTNGTRDKMSATYTIKPYVVTIPDAEITSFEYTGYSIPLNPVNFDPYGSSQTGVTSATAKGDYTARYELINTKNFIFEDDTTAAKIINWHITVKSIDKPTISNITFDYDGNSHAPTVTGFSDTWMTKTGTESSINAGNFTITVSLKDKTNTQWTGGGTADVPLTWVVNRKKLTAAQSAFSLDFETDVVTATKNGFGKLTPFYQLDTSHIVGFDSTYHSAYILNGLLYTSQIHFTSSTTNLTLHIAPKSNYCWSDGSTATKQLLLTIRRIRIPKPSLSESSSTFTGSTISPVKNYDDTYMTKLGTDSAQNVGEYSATYSLRSYSWGNDNCYCVEWEEDGTTDDVTLNWAIVKGNGFTKPTLSATSFEWTGGNISPTINNFDSNTMTKSGSDTAVALGTYSITVALKDKINTQWEGGGTADVPLTWSVTKRTLTKPGIAYLANAQSANQTSGTTTTYNGENWTAYVDTSTFNWDTNYKFVKITNTATSNFIGYTAARAIYYITAGTNAGTYPLKIELVDKDNCQWAGGGNADYTVDIIINRKLLTAAQSTFSQSGSPIYSSFSQDVTISGYDPTYHDLGSTTSAVNAGTYTATVTPKANYAFSDGSYSAKTVNWVINKATLEQLKLTNTSFTYDGNNHAPTISNYFSQYENLTGTTETATAGTYTVTVTLKDSNNFQLNNTTSTSVSKTWTINKATPTLTLDKTSATADNDTRFDVITVTYDGDADITITAADSDTAQLSYYSTSAGAWQNNKGSITISNSDFKSRNDFRIYCYRYRNTTVTISAAAGTNYTAATSKTVNVLSRYIRSLAVCGWNEIKSIIADGKALEKWNIGDQTPGFEITYSGVGNNMRMAGILLGVDHNSDVEANGKTHYADFMINWTLTDEKYSLDTPVTTTGYFSMTHTDSYTNFASSDLVSACNKFKNALPSELRNIIVTPKKYSSRIYTPSSGSGSWGTYEETVPAIWILDAAEVLGDNGKIVRYDYFSNGNKITDTAPMWTRTTENNAGKFYNNYLYAYGQNNYLGNYDHRYGNYSLGFRPCFRIGA